MDKWVEEMQDWETRPVSGGYAGLHELADEDFSGAVSAGSAWLFMVNGRVVGVFQYRRTTTEDTVEPADIDRFEDSDGTAYVAPDPSVPLLVAMKARGGESRGKYYTEDTPIEEVDETLSSGGLTGYLELSENVLSGDYYTVYQSGQSSDLAFVGNARRLLTDEEAAGRARDEVGIYEVIAVDLDVVDVPAGEEAGEEEEEEADGAAAAGGTDPWSDDENRGGGSEPSDDDQIAADEQAVTSGHGRAESESDRYGDVGPNEPRARVGDVEPAESAGAETDTDRSVGADEDTEESTVAETETDDSTVAGTETDDSTIVGTGTDDSTVAGTETDDSASEPPTDGDEGAGASESRASTEVESAEPTTEGGESAGPTTEGGESAGPTAERENGWSTETEAETDPSPVNDPLGPDDGLDSVGTDDDDHDHSGLAIPSVDPGRTGAADGSGATETVPDEEPDRTEPAETVDREPARTESAGTVDRAEQAGQAGQGDQSTEEVERLREKLSSRERELAEAREQLASVSDERDDLALEIERLRSEVERLSTDRNEDADGPSLSSAEAYAGTNLFVRYESKGKTTLEDVHAGTGDPSDLRANLRIEHHTTFPEASAAVEGQPFAEWLRATQGYRFVEWLVEDLLAEMRGAGAADGMGDLYDVLPAIDRIEFQGSVSVEDEEGEHEVDYDVVCRDRMGQPLVVANTDASREPVRKGAMADLVTQTTEVANGADTLSGAFYVTTSFFEADALETAREATSGSVLSRDRRRSFVKLSRKSGFHLCLVESRDGTFYLSVPDL